jgi:hypothetical protein
VRQAQPIYPKDLGAILVAADIHPGAKVLEAGTGTVRSSSRRPRKRSWTRGAASRPISC